MFCMNIFFPASRPGENIKMASVSPNTPHQNLDDVQDLPEIGENLIGKFSEQLIESETALHKGDANTFLETVQVHSENAESKGNSFSKNT